MKYYIQYIENDQPTSESFLSENIGLVLSWFADSVLHHTGREADDEVMRLLWDTGGVCIIANGVEHEWVMR